MIILKRILVPTDFGEAADAALRYGQTLAERFGADLHVLHVVDNPFLQARFADSAAVEASARHQLAHRVATAAASGCHAQAVVRKFDSAEDAIVAYARSEAIDLIVMGTHAREGAVHLLMGSIAERVVRVASCPVLVVRHPESEVVTATEAPASVPA
jgi:nucleotide-binding universal stress UspA family protein